MLKRRSPQRRPREPTIALINIVFLMLVFFLIAGSVAPPLDPTLDLVDTATLEGRAPPDAAVILPGGQLEYRGQATTVDDIVAQGPEVRIIPDRDLLAADLIALVGDLRRAGASAVWIVTQQALQ